MKRDSRKFFQKKSISTFSNVPLICHNSKKIMDIRIYKALLQNDEYKKGSISYSLGKYNRLLDSLEYIQETVTGSLVKQPIYERRLMPIITKYCLHCHSIGHLVSGYDITSKELNKKAKVLDVVSINVLLRAQMETYLMFEFIYRQSRTKAEVEFKYNNWIYSGLLDRVTLFLLKRGEKELEQLSPDIVEKLKRDIDEMEQFSKKLTESPIWSGFSESQQKAILEKGRPRLFDNSWKQIMKKARWKYQFGEQLYSRLSSQSHTEGLGILNLEGSQLAYHDKHEGGFQVLYVSKIYLASFIRSLMEYNSSFRIQYEFKFYNLLDELRFISGMLVKESKSK